MFTMRKPLFIAAVLSIAYTVSASDSASLKKDAGTSASVSVGKKSGDSSAVSATAPASLTLTIAELAKYNGKNGNPVYVAVDGVVYDVTNSKSWKTGRHKGKHDAGTDLTEQINIKSPHGPRVLKKWPVVGKIVAAPEKK